MFSGKVNKTNFKPAGKSVRRHVRAVIMINYPGMPRLVKFYDYQTAERQQEIIRRMYGVLRSRPKRMSNFIPADSVFGPDARLVYKTYGSLYVVFVFDASENELAVLHIMQAFVQTLDKCFTDVRELDIVFCFNKVGKDLKRNHWMLVESIVYEFLCKCSHLFYSWTSYLQVYNSIGWKVFEEAWKYSCLRGF